MGKRANLIDQKFGRLLVISFASISKLGHSEWKCKCDCGNEVIVGARHLLSDGTKSCGCYSTEQFIKRSTKHSLSDTEWYRMFNSYGLTQAEYLKWVEKQNNSCAICKLTWDECIQQKKITKKRAVKASKWCVDHDHVTGKIRGLLCESCNLAIGLLKSDVSSDILFNAYLYIKNNQKVVSLSNKNPKLQYNRGFYVL